MPDTVFPHTKPAPPPSSTVASTPAAAEALGLDPYHALEALTVAVVVVAAVILGILKLRRAARMREAELARREAIAREEDALPEEKASRQLAAIRGGNIPVIAIPDMVLQRNEEAYFVVPATLIEDRVVGRRYAGGSSGVSLRIAKGLSYRVGANRGHSEAVHKAVQAASGDLILTNRRLIFKGDDESFDDSWGNVLNFEIDGGLLKVSISRKTNPRLMTFDIDDRLLRAMFDHAISVARGATQRANTTAQCPL